MSLPIFKIKITEDDKGKEEVDYIALTDNPAIMSNFLAFNNRLKFVANEEERIIIGLAMIADLPIYRRDKERGEYYVVFTADEIKKIVQKFFRKGYQFNFNEEHNPNKKIKDVYIFESYIVDRDKGKFPMKQFEDVSNGSWFISLKIDNDQTWNDIKEGKFTGFSVEGLFGLEQFVDSKEEELSIDEALKELQNLLQSNDVEYLMTQVK